MTREEVKKSYQTRADSDGYETIRSPGKFEGEPIYAPALWEHVMDGTTDNVGSTETYSGVDIVLVEAEDRAEFPELEGVYAVAMEESDQGFVNTEEFASKEKLEKFIDKVEAQAEEEMEESEEEEGGYSAHPGYLSSSERHKRKRELTTPEQHQLKIAHQTLRMPDAMVGVMGGPSKEEARRIIERLEGKAERYSDYGKLKTETNTPAMEEHILDAAHAILGEDRNFTAEFEHGQWWIFDLDSDEKWSAVDAEGGRAVGGIDFEEI